MQGAPELVAFGRQDAAVARLEEVDDELARLDPPPALLAGLSASVTMLCLGAAVVGLLALGVDGIAHHHLERVMHAKGVALEPKPMLCSGLAEGGDKGLSDPFRHLLPV